MTINTDHWRTYATCETLTTRPALPGREMSDAGFDHGEGTHDGLSTCYSTTVGYFILPVTTGLQK